MLWFFRKRVNKEYLIEIKDSEVKLPYNSIIEYRDKIESLLTTPIDSITRSEFGVKMITTKTIKELYTIDGYIEFDIFIDSYYSLKSMLKGLKRLKRSGNPKVESIANNHYSILKEFIDSI